MNVKEAQDWLKGTIDIKSMREWGDYRYAKGFLVCHKAMKPLVEVLEKHVEWFNDLKKEQSHLLIEKQDLETASKNWKQATTLDDPLDFGPVIEALVHYRKNVLGEENQ